MRRIASMTAIVGLANTNVGQTIVRPLLESGELVRLSREVIQPYYLEKSRAAEAPPARNRESRNAVYDSI